MKEIKLQQKYKGLYRNTMKGNTKLNNLEDMDKILERYNFPKVNHEEMDNLKRLVNIQEIEIVIQNLTKSVSSGPYGFTNEFGSEFYQTFKAYLISMLLKLFKRKKPEEATFPNSFIETNTTDTKTFQRQH